MSKLLLLAILFYAAIGGHQTAVASISAACGLFKQWVKGNYTEWTYSSDGKIRSRFLIRFREDGDYNGYFKTLVVETYRSSQGKFIESRRGQEQWQRGHQ